MAGCQADTPPAPPAPARIEMAVETPAPPPFEPEIVAYRAPVIEEAQVVRRGKKVSLRLNWASVNGASSYQTQISKVLTFQRNSQEGVTRKPRFVAKRLSPGVYFWRVRAIGDAGEGAWSDVQVLDATVTGKKSKRNLVVADISPETKVTQATQEIEAMRLVWQQPRHRAVVTKSPIHVEGVATSGTKLQINTLTPITVDSTFDVAIDLEHGRNELVMTGTLDDQQKTLRRVVYYADPEKLAPIRQRFEELRKQLEEIAAIRGELTETARTLESRLKRTDDKDSIAEIKEEMDHITQIRREIDQEINSALGNLDELLTDFPR